MCRHAWEGPGLGAGTKFLAIAMSFQCQGWAGPKVMVNSGSGDINRVNEPLRPLPVLMKALGSGLCVFSEFWGFDPQSLHLGPPLGASLWGLGNLDVSSQGS